MTAPSENERKKSPTAHKGDVEQPNHPEVDVEILAEEVSAQDQDAPQIEIPQDPLVVAQQQAKEHLELAQRKAAELENYRRRTMKEREDLLRYGSERVLHDVLAVMDDVERGQEHAQDDSPLAEGFRMIHNQLEGLLKRHNVTEVPGVGEKFDPEIHNALQKVPSDTLETGQVAAVYQKGYKLHERLLRPAQVAVVE